MTTIMDKVCCIASSNQNLDEIFMLLKTKEVVRYNMRDKSSTSILALKDTQLNLGMETMMVVSPDDKYIIVAEKYGQFSELYDVTNSYKVLGKSRGTYHCNVTIHSVGFCLVQNKPTAILGTAWNQIDMFDAATGQILTERDRTRQFGYFSDYFHGRIYVSPDYAKFVDCGWVWQPAGAPFFLHCETWAKNPYDCESRIMFDADMKFIEETEEQKLRPKSKLDIGVFDLELMYNPGCWISNNGGFVSVFGNTWDSECILKNIWDPDVEYNDTDNKDPREAPDPRPDRKPYVLYLTSHKNGHRVICEFDSLINTHSFEKDCEIVSNGHIYIYHKDGGIVVFDFVTGEEVYRNKWIVPVGFQQVSRKFILPDKDAFTYWTYPGTVGADYKYLSKSKRDQILTVYMIRKKESNIINKLPVNIFNYLYTFL
jgi:hypothetical protein